MRVVRDRTTKQMRLMWNVINDPLIGQPIVELGDNEEMVDIPSMDHDTAMQLAVMKTNGKPGKVFVHDDRVEAEEAIPPTPITDGIKRNRRINNTPPDAPVSIEEFRQAEMEMQRARMGTQTRL